MLVHGAVLDGSGWRAVHDLLVKAGVDVTVAPDHFHEDVAADLPEDVSAFMAAAQTPTSLSVYMTALPQVSWHDKPSFGVIATRDRTLDPAMPRFMYERSAAEIVEVEAAHLPHISQPEMVADIIVGAAAAE